MIAYISVALLNDNDDWVMLEILWNVEVFCGIIVGYGGRALWYIQQYATLKIWRLFCAKISSSTMIRNTLTPGNKRGIQHCIWPLYFSYQCRFEHMNILYEAFVSIWKNLSLCAIVNCLSVCKSVSLYALYTRTLFCAFMNSTAIYIQWV